MMDQLFVVQGRDGTFRLRFEATVHGALEVVDEAPEFVAMPRSWLTTRAGGRVDGRVIRLGTNGQGVGVVAYEVPDVPPDDRLFAFALRWIGSDDVTIRRVDG